MSRNISKALLTGTALVAVSFCVSTAALAATDTPTSNTSYNAQAGDDGMDAVSNTVGDPGGNGTEGVITGDSGLTLTNDGTITGGRGGHGGEATDLDEAGGNAGSAAAAISIVHDDTTIDNTQGNSITGGAGGNGGNATSGDAFGGNGSGGASAIITSNAGTIINNSGSITGGNGGTGGIGIGAGGNGTNGNGGYGIEINATGATINNTSTGVITSGTGNADGYGIYVNSTDFILNNDGAVNGNVSAAILVVGGATNATINNNATGTITSTGNGNTVVFNGAITGGALINANTISSDTGSAVILNSAITFDNTGGTITNAGSGVNAALIIGTDQTASGNFTNAGTISNTRSSDDDGVALMVAANQTDTNRIINSGTITSDGTGTAQGIAVWYNGASGVFENAGTISGRFLGDAADNTFINSAGTMTGDIILDSGTNALTVSGGTVTGNVTSGNNDDTYTLSGGTLTGNITAGDGANSLTKSGAAIFAGSYYGGAGVDTIDISGTGTLTGDIDVGTGNNSITISAGTVTGNLSADVGDDEFILSGGTLSGSIYAGDGENSLTKSGASIMSGDYNGGAGDDTVTLSGTGTLTGDVNLGDGTNAFTLTAGTLTGDVNGGTGNDEVTITAGTLTGAVNLGDGSNTLDLNGGTLTGAITGGTGSDQITMGGGAHVGTIDLGAGINLIDIDEDYTTNNTIAATGGSVDIYAFNNSTVNVGHVISDLGELDIEAGSTFNLNVSNGANGGAGSLHNNGTIELANGTTLNVNDFTAGTGQFNFNVANSGNNMTAGTIAVTNGSADLTGSKVFVKVPQGVGVLGSNAVAIVTTTGGVTGPAAEDVTDNSALYDFSLTVDGNDLLMTAVRASGGLEGMAIAQGSPTAVGVGAAFDSMGNSSNPEIADFQIKLAAAGSQAEIVNLLNSVAPTVDASASASSATVTNQSLSLTNARLSSLRGARSGSSAGDALSQGRVWVQPFAVSVDQDTRSGVAGYESDTYGVAVGADTDNLLQSSIVGLAFSYGRTDADSKNINNTNSDIDSYQIMAYADHDLGNRAFVDGSIGYGKNKIDQTRFAVGGTPGVNADADYDSNQYFAAVGLGQTYTPVADKALEITPRIGARYTYLDTDRYTETGAGGLGLAVDTDANKSLELAIATEAAYNVNLESGQLSPAVHVGYTYDAVGDDLQTTSAFTGGSPSFNTNGAEPAQSTFNAGASLSYYSNENIDLSINYDAQVKSDYTAHAGYVKAIHKF